MSEDLDTSAGAIKAAEAIQQELFSTLKDPDPCWMAPLIDEHGGAKELAAAMRDTIRELHNDHTYSAIRMLRAALDKYEDGK